MQSAPLPSPSSNPPLPEPAQPFGDLQTLIDASRPNPPFKYAGTLVTAAWVAVVVAWVINASVGLQVGLQAIAWIATLSGSTLAWSLNNARRAESTELIAIEDLIALKQYDQAGPRLHWLMLRPMRSQEHRLRALLLLATLLSRMMRHEDALVIYNELIDTERVGGPGGAMVKLGRAMALLYADHLYDADRAINDLRRLIDRGGAASELRQMEISAGLDADERADFNDIARDGADPANKTDLPAPSDGAGVPVDTLSIAALRLVELFRDVKTGHITEALDLFHAQRDTLRRGLGHRVGEAHALAAVAYDRAGRESDAARAFADATALQPMADILNRYVEVRPLIAKYKPTPAPTM